MLIKVEDLLIKRFCFVILPTIFKIDCYSGKEMGNSKNGDVPALDMLYASESMGEDTLAARSGGIFIEREKFVNDLDSAFGPALLFCCVHFVLNDDLH
jgi:hypothetical protein